jgi:hypothetical protein
MSNNEPNEICDAANNTFATIMWIKKVYFSNFMQHNRYARD